MRRAGDGVHGRRLRGLIVVLWRAGLRISEALALAEADLTRAAARCSCGAARAAAAARSAWTTGPGNSLRPGSTTRVELPVENPIALRRVLAETAGRAISGAFHECDLGDRRPKLRH